MKMSSFLSLVAEWMRRGERIRPGLYRYVRESEGATVPFHLRVDASADGLLLAKASAVARLSGSGVVIAKGLLEGEAADIIARRLKKLFRGATAEVIAADIAATRALIERMIAPDGSYPLLNLTDPAFSPKSALWGRPISADVPLCAPFHMTRILDRLWESGIPHVTVVVGRDPEEEHLVRAVERAGDLGMVCGVRGRGGDLHRGNRIAAMATAGLDHLDVYCLSHQPEIHDSLAGSGDFKMATGALCAARRNEVCAVAQLTIVRRTLPTMGLTLESLAKQGIENVGVLTFADKDGSGVSDVLLAHELVPVATHVEETAERLGVRILWYPTMQFDLRRPLGEQVCQGPRCSGDTAIRVEPDGTVFAARGPFASAGNLLESDWETIDRSDVFQAYRTRLESDTHCENCPGLAVCAGDCPREPRGWAMPHGRVVDDRR